MIAVARELGMSKSTPCNTRCSPNHAFTCLQRRPLVLALDWGSLIVGCIVMRLWCQALRRCNRPRKKTAMPLSKSMVTSRTKMPAAAFVKNSFWGRETQLKI